MILPRFFRRQLEVEDRAKLDAMEREWTPPDPVGGGTAGGDSRRLRGVPAIARGVAGVSPGTDPFVETERRLRGRRA